MNKFHWCSTRVKVILYDMQKSWGSYEINESTTCVIDKYFLRWINFSEKSWGSLDIKNQLAMKLIQKKNSFTQCQLLGISV